MSIASAGMRRKGPRGPQCAAAAGVPCEGQALALRGPGGAFFSVPCEGQALALRAPGRVFFVVRGPSRLYQSDAGFPASPTLPPQSLTPPGHPGNPASDARDIKVFQTFFSLILAILQILAILLQTAERVRGTGPRTTGRGGALFFIVREPVPRNRYFPFRIRCSRTTVGAVSNRAGSLRFWEARLETAPL